jgi:signal transduction histidine kinase
MVQEALTNIEKHAGSRRVALAVRRLKKACGKAQRSGLLVCVSDDGTGLPPEPRPSSGLGMRSMKEQAAVLGARLDFISESGNGFMVRIETPLNTR